MAESPVKGKLGTVEFSLASWVPHAERYQRRYRSVDPQSDTLSGDVAGLVAYSPFRPWVVRDWGRGEGFDTWERGSGGYREASGVRPHPTESGLTLVRQAELAQDAAGNFTEGRRIAIGVGYLWAMNDETGYRWDPSSEEFGNGADTGHASTVVVVTDGIADGSDDANMFSVGSTGNLYKWPIDNSGGSTLVAASSFSYVPRLVTFDGVLYALDGDDLYEVNQSTGALTHVGDTAGASSEQYLADDGRWRRLTVNDVGPVWLQRVDNGQTYIWQYNVAAAVQERLGKLPMDFAWPWDIHYANGFLFVTFRLAPSNSGEGTGYLYFQRGGQSGVLPALRESSASGPMPIAGMVGSDLVFNTIDKVWAYDTDAGGIFEFADNSLAFGVSSFREMNVFGEDVFGAPSSASGQEYVAYIPKGSYHTSGTVKLGWHDWDYPGLIKKFLDVTVITDPLPAGTSVTAAVAVDGDTATYTALSGTHDEDDKTVFKFTVANPTTAPIIGRRFEVELTLTGTASAAPVVKEVAARATGAEATLEVLMVVDVSSRGRQVDEAKIAALNGLRNDEVTFLDPFQKRDGQTAESYTVKVHDVVTPSVEDPATEDDFPEAVVVVHGVELV